MQADRLNIRLFIEGVEIPVVAATVTCAENSAMQATMQLVPNSAASGILERSIVHLYKLEHHPWDYRPGDEWKLVFTGEIIGIQYTKSPVSRGFMIQCMDFSNYWDSVYMMNTTGLGRQGQQLASFAGANTAVLSGGKTDIFGGGGKSGFDKIIKIVNKPPASFPKMKGVLAGIIHLFERIGGFYYGERTFKGFNDFTSVAELRCKILQQIHACEDDDSSMKLLDKKSLSKWVKNSVGGRGSLESFGQVAGKLMQIIYHSRQSIPGPPYFPGSENTKLINRWIPVNTQVARVQSTISNTIWAMKGLPHSNANLQILKGRIERMIDTPIMEDNGAGVLESITNKLYSILRDISVGSLTLEKAVERLEQIGVNLESVPRSKKEPTLESGKYERLGVHVLKPDLFFAPPPKCNVLFPELYSSFEWGRNFLGEPTRLMLHSGSGKKGDIFGGGYSRMGVYFAPDIPSVRNSLKLSSKKFAAHIMDHELLAGIIPTQVEIPWAKTFKIDVGVKGEKYRHIQRMANHEFYKRHLSARNASVSGKLNLSVLPGFPILIIDKPMTYEIEEFMESDSDLGPFVAPQYLGYCAAVTHTMDQTGGTTSYQITMLRSHKEDGEKFGLAGERKWSESVSKGTRTHIAIGGPADKLKAVKYGPTGGKIIKVTPAGKAVPGRMYWVARDKASRGAQAAGGAASAASGVSGAGAAIASSAVGGTSPWYRRRYTLPERSTQSNISYKKLWRQAQQWVEDGKESTYRVVESKGSKKVDKTEEIGLEAAITPPWLAKVWHTDKISSTYKKLFGIGSILDEIGVEIEEE